MSYTASTLTAAKTIAISERDLPPAVPDGHVRLQLATASLCGTDLHYYRHFANAGFALKAPVTLGHEACARVVDANGADLSAGALVALNPIIKCGVCPACDAGMENLCTAKRFPGSATTVPHIDGFFRAFFDFPAACCHVVPAATDPDHLTFAEPLACAMHAVNCGRVGARSRVMVTGCGPMGLLTVVAAHAKGAHVEATDMRAEATALAQTIGARAGHLADSTDFAAHAGTFDVVIEASGSPHAFNQALDLVKRRGTIVILSNIQPSNTPIDLHKIMIKEVEVTGSFQFNKEFREAMDLITGGTVDFNQMVAARFPLEETQDALDFMLAGKAAGKILLKPSI